jgi:site-specific DNA recombinase
MDKKRVWALYRVSTDKQVEEDDIPMQRKAVHEYIQERPNWILCKELSELGVSGFKKSIEERDQLQLIKQGAEKGEFDILVVWKDDRLGRNKFEIPIMLEYLQNKGIEVWSVKDGILNNGDHNTSVISFLRYWAAEGESKKTSIRVKERLSQMQKENLWTGGKPPYGYELYDTDKKHPKKDKYIKEFRIIEKEAETVRLIFDLVENKGFGAQRIAQYLNENGYRTRANKPWRQNAINRILRNPIYTGYRRYNVYDETNSKMLDRDEWKLQDYREDLQIVPKETFISVQNIIDNRLNWDKNNTNEPVVTKSNFLFTGFAYCGYCGHRLKADYSVKKTPLKNGGVYIYNQRRYCCHYGKNNKTGHETVYFSAIKYEKEVEDYVFETVEKIQVGLYADKFKKEQHALLIKMVKELNDLQKQKSNLEIELNVLNDEVVNALMGKGKFKPELLAKLIEQKEKEIDQIKDLIDKKTEEVKSKENELNDLDKLQIELDGWREKYEKSDINAKKVMMSRVIKKIEFKRDQINLTLRIPYNPNPEPDSEVLGDDNQPVRHAVCAKNTPLKIEDILQMVRSGNIEFDFTFPIGG